MIGMLDLLLFAKLGAQGERPCERNVPRSCTWLLQIHIGLEEWMLLLDLQTLDI